MLNTQRTLFGEQDPLVMVRLTRLQAIVSLFQALGGGWVLPEDMRARGRSGARRGGRIEGLEMKLGRILPIAVGVAVVLAVGGYVVMGKQQEQQQKLEARPRVPGPAGAGARRARQQSPTCRSISTRSATPAR